MRRRRHLLLALLLFLGLTASLPASTAGAKAKTIPFADARLKIEVNATDGDAGLQVFLDSEPWRAVSLYNPSGRKLVEITAKGPLKNYGLTELFSESSEPSFDVFLSSSSSSSSRGRLHLPRHDHRRQAPAQHGAAHPRHPRRTQDRPPPQRRRGAARPCRDRMEAGPDTGRGHRRLPGRGDPRGSPAGAQRRPPGPCPAPARACGVPPARRRVQGRGAGHRGQRQPDLTEIAHSEVIPPRTCSRRGGLRHR